MRIFRGRRDDEPVDMNERSPQLGIRYKDLAILDQLMKNGADLTESRHVVYYAYAPSEAEAQAMGHGAESNGFAVTIGEPLPDFPGAHPLEDLLTAGAKEAAATVHVVDEGVDTGPVLASEPVPVLPEDTVDSLRERVHAAEHRLLPRVVRELCER